MIEFETTDDEVVAEIDAAFAVNREHTDPMRKLGAAMATLADAVVREKKAVDALRTQVATLTRDAERARYCIANAQWIRDEHVIDYDAADEPVIEVRTYLKVRVPNGSDLSCAPMKEDAIDAAIAAAASGGGHTTNGGTTPAHRADV